VARVLGVGGVFFKATNPAELGAWYEKWLGLPIDASYGGASFGPDAMPPGGLTVWSPFKADTEYFKPSDQAFMFNLVVDDLDAALEQVREGGAEVMPDRMDESYGRFGWFVDPEGNKVELWEPKQPEA